MISTKVANVTISKVCTLWLSIMSGVTLGNDDDDGGGDDDDDDDEKDKL